MANPSGTAKRRLDTLLADGLIESWVVAYQDPHGQNVFEVAVAEGRGEPIELRTYEVRAFYVGVLMGSRTFVE